MKELKGRGEPAPNLNAVVGEKYRDELTNKVYRLTDDGWEKCAQLVIDPLPAQRGMWLLAARERKMTLEDFVMRTLDAKVRAGAK